MKSLVLVKEIEEMKEKFEEKLSEQNQIMREEIEREKAKSNRYLSQISALKTYNQELNDEVE